MKSQLGQIDDIHLNVMGEGPFVSISLPDDFNKMDLPSRIIYVANELKSLESKYPIDKGALIRHTSLVKFGKGKVEYSIGYIPLVDSEY